MAEVIVIEPEPQSWAVKHNGGFLGRTGTREQALAVASALVQWISEQGRSVEAIEQPDGKRLDLEPATQARPITPASGSA